MTASPWDKPETVAGFVASAPNATLLRFAEGELTRAAGGVALDLGCGAGRNAIPLARLGWKVLGLDLSWPMLVAANEQVTRNDLVGRFCVALAPMDHLPARDASCDLVVAHGIWNLAPSTSEFRRAVHEAARVARPRAGLFVFTFSRNTLPPQVAPVAGEAFAFTEFSGQPQCFLTENQLVDELAAAGFLPDPAVPLRELNRPSSSALRAARTPVIYEAAFRRS